MLPEQPDSNNSDLSDTTDTDAHDVDSDTPEVHIPINNENEHGEQMETWADWIRRCTREAERQLAALGIDDWVTMQRRRKWRFASKVIADTHKWGLKALMWDPTLDPRLSPRRRQARPKTRWQDDINKYINQQYSSHLDDNNSTTNNNNTQDLWISLAQHTELWDELESNYVAKNWIDTTALA